MYTLNKPEAGLDPDVGCLQVDVLVVKDQHTCRM